MKLKKIINEITKLHEENKRLKGENSSLRAGLYCLKQERNNYALEAGYSVEEIQTISGTQYNIYKDDSEDISQELKESLENDKPEKVVDPYGNDLTDLTESNKLFFSLGLQNMPEIGVNIKNFNDAINNLKNSEHPRSSEEWNNLADEVDKTRNELFYSIPPTIYESICDYIKEKDESITGLELNCNVIDFIEENEHLFQNEDHEIVDIEDELNEASSYNDFNPEVDDDDYYGWNPHHEEPWDRFENVGDEDELPISLLDKNGDKIRFIKSRVEAYDINGSGTYGGSILKIHFDNSYTFTIYDREEIIKFFEYIV